MTQKTDAHNNLSSREYSDRATFDWQVTRSLLVKSISCVGGLGILSSGLGLAHTALPEGIKQKASVKSVPDTRQRAIVAPQGAVGTAPRREGTVVTAPVPIKREVTKPETPKTSNLPLQRIGSVNTPAKIEPSLPTALRTKTPSTVINNDTAYIDPTKYSVGATGSSQAPSQVVLMERSTGCKAVLSAGQGVSNNLCGAVAVPRLSGLQPQVLSRLGSRPQPQARRLEPNSSQEAQPLRWNNSRQVAITAPIEATSNYFVSSNSVAMPPAAPATPSALSNVGEEVLPKSVTLPPRSGILEYQQLLQPNQLSADINTGMLFPLSIPAPITSIFGWRVSPFGGGSSFHAGTDLGAPLGTPVLAAYSGNVVVANYMGGYGLAVVLEHKNPVEQTLYGHLSQVFVQPGQWVEQGTAIGRVGSTGMSTGPHLHFEVRQMTPQGWVATDPGTQVQSAMTQLVQAVRVAQVPSP